MTTIGPSLVITGDLTCQEDITIHGRVNGQITMTQGTLVIAPTGNVDASIEGGKIAVHGTVKGDVLATERLELTESANVSGTISAPAIALKEGATFNGMVDMATKKAGGAKPAAVKPADVAAIA